METLEQNKCSKGKKEEQTTEFLFLLFASTLIRRAETNPGIKPQIGFTIKKFYMKKYSPLTKK